jgi:hypothetical protein
MELAETLVLVGMIRRYVVGESEEEESEGFSRDEVEAGFLGATRAWFGFERVVAGLRNSFHLLESVYDRGVEFVFVGKMVLEVMAACKYLWTEGTPVASREPTEKAVEVELAERRGDVSAVLTMEEGKVARVHPGVLDRGECRGLIESLSRRGVGRMFIDEVCLEAIPVFE